MLAWSVCDSSAAKQGRDLLLACVESRRGDRAGSCEFFCCCQVLKSSEAGVLVRLGVTTKQGRDVLAEAVLKGT